MEQCLTPIPVKKEGYSHSFTHYLVPCGRCPTCIKRRAKNWLFRLQEEQKSSSSAAFITLTYNDENIPKNSQGNHTLVKAHLQGFIKNLRNFTNRTFRENHKLKYYGVGEYGDKFGRPHYHAIIYNLPSAIIDHPNSMDIVWKNSRKEIRGRTECVPANDRSMAYVAGYVAKKFKKNDLNHEGLPEFNLMSKGLGLSYVTKRKKAYLKKVKIPYFITEGGKKQAIPRYYKDKIWDGIERKEIARSLMVPIDDDMFDSERHKIEFIKESFKQFEINSKHKRNANTNSSSTRSRNSRKLS